MRFVSLLVVAALMALIPTNVSAGPVATCLAKAEADGNVVPGSCIGVSSGPCLEKPDNVSTVAQVDCLYGEQAEWDDVLNATYQKLLKAVTKPVAEKVRKSQRAWLAARETDCGLYYDLVEGGSIHRQLGAECNTNQTARRTLQLRAWLDLVAPN